MFNLCSFDLIPKLVFNRGIHHSLSINIDASKSAISLKPNMLISYKSLKFLVGIALISEEC